MKTCEMYSEGFSKGEERQARRPTQPWTCWQGQSLFTSRSPARDSLVSRPALVTSQISLQVGKILPVRSSRGRNQRTRHLWPTKPEAGLAGRPRVQMARSRGKYAAARLTPIPHYDLVHAVHYLLAYQNASHFAGSVPFGACFISHLDAARPPTCVSVLKLDSRSLVHLIRWHG